MAAKCNICNVRRVQTGAKSETAPQGSDMCNYCYEEGSWENAHQDEGHKEPTIATPALTDGCWICHPELNLAQKPVKSGVASKNAGYVRRPQLNHKGHSHPQTPAARRACKAAFWASLTPVKNVSTDPQIAQAMAAWDCNVDGNGRFPVTAPKGGWAGVVPQAKNGKANLKAAQAKVDAVNASK